VLQFESLLPLLPWIVILAVWMAIFLVDAWFHLERYGVDVAPFILMARTRRFNNLLDRLGRWHPRAWRILWSGFVAVCFFFSVAGFLLLFRNLLAFFFAPSSAEPVVPLVPGVTMSFSFFAMLLLPLIISVVVHEMAHGVAARADEIPVKSAGLFAVFILFGAFVEPDDEYLKTKATRRAKLRLFAAGSAANLSLALVVLLVATALIVHVPQGALITGIVPGSSADGVLTPWTVITGMNDTPIATLEDLSSFLDHTRPGDLIVFTINGQQVNLTVGAHPNNSSRAYIGIFLRTYFPLLPPLQALGPAFAYEFQRAMGWFFIIAFSLAVMNLLPIPPLDGDKMYKELIDATLSLDRASGLILLYSLRIFALLLLILNVALTFLRLLALLFG